jgi:hypothetical protein
MALPYVDINGIMAQLPQEVNRVCAEIRCMTNSHVVSALRLKRAEISGHIHDLENKDRALAREPRKFGRYDQVVFARKASQGRIEAGKPHL